MIAFIGTGHLGASFVRALLQQGQQVQVWNRTATKAQALESYGARAFEDAAAAVRGASVIHLTLKDDAVVDEVLEQAHTGFLPGAVIIDHTTTSVEGAVARTRQWQERGFTYLHAPVFMGPQNALEGSGYMMVSGDQDTIKAWMPHLSEMTGKVINLGPETGKAAGMKLVGNLFLLTLTAGITDTLSLAKGLGISTGEVMRLFEDWNPGAAMPARMRRLIAGNFDAPTWELSMARKDAGLMLAAAQNTDSPLLVIPQIAQEMDQWIARGMGQKDWMIVGKNALPDQ